MDVDFLLRAQRLLAERRPARLDFSLLTAALAVQRSAVAPTASDGRRSTLRIDRGGEEALVELLLSGPSWRQAASEQQGCFSRAEAGRRLNGL